MSVRKIREYLQADSLAYLSVEGMKTAVGAENGFCAACFDRNYPLPRTPRAPQRELFEMEGV